MSEELTAMSDGPRLRALARLGATARHNAALASDGPYYDRAVVKGHTRQTRMGAFHCDHPDCALVREFDVAVSSVAPQEEFIRCVREEALRLQRKYKLSSAAATQEAFNRLAEGQAAAPVVSPQQELALEAVRRHLSAELDSGFQLPQARHIVQHVIEQIIDPALERAAEPVPGVVSPAQEESNDDEEGSASVNGAPLPGSGGAAQPSATAASGGQRGDVGGDARQPVHGERIGAAEGPLVPTRSLATQSDSTRDHVAVPGVVSPRGKQEKS